MPEVNVTSDADVFNNTPHCCLQNFSFIVLFRTSFEHSSGKQAQHFHLTCGGSLLHCDNGFALRKLECRRHFLVNKHLYNLKRGSLSFQ